MKLIEIISFPGFTGPHFVLIPYRNEVYKIKNHMHEYDKKHVEQHKETISQQQSWNFVLFLYYKVAFGGQ